MKGVRGPRIPGKRIEPTKKQKSKYAERREKKQEAKRWKGYIRDSDLVSKLDG